MGATLNFKLKPVPPQQKQADLDSYKSELVSNLADAWKMALKHVKQAQRHQKTAYDRSAKPPSFRVGNRALLYMLAADSNKAIKSLNHYKASTVLSGCTRLVAEFQPVDHPRASPIRVAMNRLQSCLTELAGVSASTPPSAEESPNNSQQVEHFPDPPKEPDQDGVSEVWGTAFVEGSTLSRATEARTGKCNN